MAGYDSKDVVPPRPTIELEAWEKPKIEEAVREYLLNKHGWAQNDFRIEHKGVNDRDQAVVWAIYLADLSIFPLAAGGQSLILFVDRKKFLIVKELGFQ
jgi:hypothetical protein